MQRTRSLLHAARIRGYSQLHYILAKVQKNTTLERGALIYKCALTPAEKAHIYIGKKCTLINSQLRGGVCLKDGVTVRGVLLRGDVRIDAHTSIMGPNTIVSAGISKISIGKYCSIARRVTILATGHCSDRIMTATVGKRLVGKKLAGTSCSKGEIHIGHDVWIGVNAVVLDGVSIGNGAVIGANAVVTENIPAYAIAVGVPARVIKYRFDEKIIARLQDLKIWDFPENVLIKNLEIFEQPLNENILECLEIEKQKGFSKNRTEEDDWDFEMMKLFSKIDVIKVKLQQILLERFHIGF
ncbi:MAG: CatB-related O-acetyltransferase, partial [Chloroflexota bacterium]|nr:CatB-related O-acetyltransferase [Chloroflexota bacterium]